MVNRVPRPSGVSVKVRSPLNRPSGIPPDQIVRSYGRSSVTVTGNARPRLIFEKTLILAPSAISPTTRSTPESQVEYPDASVRTAQTPSGLASISDVPSYDFMACPPGRHARG